MKIKNELKLLLDSLQWDQKHTFLEYLKIRMDLEFKLQYYTRTENEEQIKFYRERIEELDGVTFDEDGP